MPAGCHCGGSMVVREVELVGGGLPGRGGRDCHDIVATAEGIGDDGQRQHGHIVLLGQSDLSGCGSIC